MKDLLIDQGLQTKIVHRLMKKLRENYIFPETADQICESLAIRLESGEYEEITKGYYFAYVLTQHIQEINQDEHLWVKWHPQALPEGEDALRQNQAWKLEQIQAAQLDNFGFHKVERLPGHVGYLDIHQFCRPEWGGDLVVAAMNLVANTRALIIDLRKCTGGYPSMVTLVSSYLFGDDPIHLGSIYWRDEDLTQQYWTLPYLPGLKFIDKPVYLLVSRETFSGGEAFAYDLQAQKRALVIGEKTDGGAHAGASFRLHPHFEAFIPVGRAINPITKDNWECAGITPDFQVEPQDAFDLAYKMALQAVIQSLDNMDSAPFKRLLKEASSALQSLDSTTDNPEP